MKRLIEFSLIFISLSTKAQTSNYFPFPDSNATWCAWWGAETGCNSTLPSYTNFATYQLSGHVLINGITYGRLLHFETIVDNCSPDTTIDTTTYFIRQDTSLKKVWLYDSATNSDTILFDFDLHIGDTLDATKEYWARNSVWCIVSSIDSILINGQYRRRYNYAPIFDSTCVSSMIEGIGSSHGLMYRPNTCFEYDALLTNFMQNNQLLYFGSYPCCWPATAYYCQALPLYIHDKIYDKMASVFPNPFHFSSTLKLKMDFVNSRMKVYDSLGELVRQQSINSQVTLLYRDNLRAGIYFYQIENNKEETITGKFIIN